MRERRSGRTRHPEHQAGGPVDSKKFDSVPSSAAEVTRRDFVQRAMAGATVVALGGRSAIFASLDDREAVLAQVGAQHDATVKMLQDWIALPSIAAENRNYPQGPEYMAKLA